MKYLPSVRFSCVAVLCAAVLVPPVNGFADQPHPVIPGRIASSDRPAVPENYHARFDEAVDAELAKIGDSTVRPELTPAERDAALALAARVPSLRISRDEYSLLPTSVLSIAPGAMLARSNGRSGDTPESTARGFLAANKALYGMSDDDLATLSMRYVTSPERGATIVKFDQIVGGVQLFDTEIAVAMTKQLDVSAVAGRMMPDVAAGSSALSNFRLPKQEAIANAIADLTGRQVAAADFVTASPDVDSYSYFAFAPDGSMAPERRFLSEDTRIKPVLFPLAAGRFVAGYYLELWVHGDPGGSGPVFSYVISAEDGRMLFRNNLSQNETFAYRTYAESSGDFRPWDGPTGAIGTPHPTGIPDGYQAPFLSPAPLVSIESLLGPTDPWLPNGATVTTGNNTDAYLDLSSPDGFSAGDVRGTGSSNTFDAQYDSNQNVDVAVNRQAAVIGMFYQVNWQHDFWYQHGFNEASGNAQTDNYGRHPTGGNDSVKSEGQDSSGTDNANMTTPADGSRPKMQMYKFSAAGRLNPTRDGTFDMLIVGHEIMHYMSNRLVGNASGLTNRQGGSMGEGWADFNAILATALDTDNVVDTVYAVGGQTDKFWCGATFVDNYYYSIRRYPYSSSKLKNPLTFKDIGPGITTYPGVSGNPCTSLTGSPAEVHNSGEIWSNVLWECFVGLSRAYGVSSGRRKIMQYVIDGLKMTPSQPTFTEARDGVIGAANAANGYANPQDAQILWQAFAKRGMGRNAVSPLRTSNNHSGVVEDFTAEPGLVNDTVGIYTGGAFFERDVLFGGDADRVVPFGAGGLTPLVGNWDGGGGVGAPSADTPGLYDSSTGSFFLRFTNTPGPADLTFGYGPAGAVPIVGDWNGDGTTTIGIYIPATGAFFLRNTNSGGAADLVFTFGPTSSTMLPIAGDWNNDGIDTIGLYDPSTGAFFLKNSNTPGSADLVFTFGAPGAMPLAGDWDLGAPADLSDSVGIYFPGTGVFFLRNSNTPGPADFTVVFGPAGASPVAGNFDGQ